MMFKNAFSILSTILLSFCCISITNAQTGNGFLKYYNTESAAASYIGLSDLDGNLVIAGPTHLSERPVNSDIQIIKTDVEGNIIWANSYDWATDEVVKTLIPTSDGGYFIGGAAIGKQSDALVIRLDKDGNVVWSHIYGTTTEDESITAALSMADGSVMVAGPVTGRFNNGTIDDSSIGVWRLQPNGHKEWEIITGTSEYETVVGIHPTALQGLVFTGTQGDPALRKSDLLLFNIGPNSQNVRWSKNYSTGVHEVLNFSSLTKDERIVLTGTTKFGSLNTSAFLAKVDFAGNIDWANWYRDTGDIIATSTGPVEGNELVFSGYTDHATPGKQDIFILRTDENGNYLWGNSYGHPDVNDYNYRLTCTVGHDYVIFGHTEAGDNANALLLKTDDLGQSFCYQQPMIPTRSNYPLDMSNLNFDQVDIPDSERIIEQDAIPTITPLDLEVGAWCAVWPGDTNDDGEANQWDLLDIGLAYEYTGDFRPNASTNWEAQIYPDTLRQFPETYFMHADANGDGFVNYIDKEAIIQNYQRRHTQLLPPSTPDIADMDGIPFFAEVQDTIIENAEFEFGIHLGDETQMAEEVYGLAFTTQFTLADPDAQAEGVVLNDPVLSYEDSWLGKTSDGSLLTLDTIFKDIGQWDIAMTRVDHIAVAGEGIVCKVACVMEITHFKTVANDTYLPVNIFFDNVKIVRSDGMELPAKSFSKTVYIELQGDDSNRGNMSFGPVPTGNQLTINYSTPEPTDLQIHIFDLNGHLIGEADFEARSGRHRYTVNTTSLPVGTYLLRATSKANTWTKKLLIAR